MSHHPFTWFDASRIGSEVTQLLTRTATLASVVVDRLTADVDGDVGGDVGGEQPTEVVALSYRGVDYEIDLTQNAANGLDQMLAPYLAKARPVTVQRSNTRRPAAAASVVPNPREVRAWARTQGIVIAERGRVSADVMRQYREAHHG